MRKVALVFVLAVLAPSLTLAWLALRSLRDQQLVVERQHYLLCQGEADKLADMAGAFVADQQTAFRAEVESLLAQTGGSEPTRSFDSHLRGRWPLAQVGFVESTAGSLLCPAPDSSPQAEAFCVQNEKFLGDRESAKVFFDAKLQKNAPQKRSDAQPLSKIACADSGFRELVGDSTEGALARFLDDKLNVLFWYRSPSDPQMIFGALLDNVRLRESLAKLPSDPGLAPALQKETCLVILDDTGKPVGMSKPGFTANWKKPFVTAEIGEALPHWQAAVFLVDPSALSRTAGSLKLMLGLLIAVLVSVIAAGGWLILHCVTMELDLARQKTDFVSNVSHELKTPLTSIRMFSELLAEGRVSDPARQRSYLEIITAEAARLTRLINNVLDFSRLERGEKKYNFQRCDLGTVAQNAAQTFRPHLQAGGFAFDCSLTQDALPVRGDGDALSQIIVNLLSNAEKYSNGCKEIALRVRRGESPALSAEILVMDRGLGVPRGSEEKIFEKFYRAHGSLSSGIEGSGLGLTLARHIARAHGGDIVYEPREGGGSCFRLRVPLAEPAS